MFSHCGPSLSLGGDSKTLMVVCVSPVSNNVPETVCSLNFAQRVKTVELGQASRRVAEDTAISRIRADTVSNSRYVVVVSFEWR